MKLPDYLLWNRSHRGEALVDLIVGTASLGIIMVALFGAVLGILGQSSNITKRIQANWVANSYMEQITHFPFTDPDDIDPEDGSDRDDVDDFDDYSVVNYGLTVTVNVNDAEVNEGIISFSDSPLDNPDFKQVRVTVSDGGLGEPIELKTLVALDQTAPVLESIRLSETYNVDGEGDLFTLNLSSSGKYEGTSILLRNVDTQGSAAYYACTNSVYTNNVACTNGGGSWVQDQEKFRFEEVCYIDAHPTSTGPVYEYGEFTSSLF